ncbi:MAG: hypothetical protein EON87_19835 [Brevundimonas sp.]|nr:MAG: hypothetical protein EON87_19835 [Brevundimonas sp.]
MDLLAVISYGAAVAVGIMLIGGFLFAANIRDARNARHPGGTRGRLMDEVIVLVPLVPLLGMLSTGAFVPDLRDAGWWLPTSFALVALGLGASFLPVVRHARARLTALRGEPAQ